MRKRDELLAGSCFSRGGMNEMMFVLLGRDVAAPTAIRAWAKMRVRMKKNKRSDSQIQEALMCAAIMEQEALRTANANPAAEPNPPEAKQK
jgi:hypothetical protein